MTSDIESLKERLCDPANHCPYNMGCNCAPVCMCALNDEALARIEELEAENERLNTPLRKYYEGYYNTKIDEQAATIATLQGKLDRALDTINKVFGIAYPHPSRTYDTMIKDMGLIDDLCRSILSDLPEREDLTPIPPQRNKTYRAGRTYLGGPEMTDSLKERLAGEADAPLRSAELGDLLREALARIEELEMCVHQMKASSLELDEAQATITKLEGLLSDCEEANCERKETIAKLEADAGEIVARLHDYGRPLWATDRDEAASLIERQAAEIETLHKACSIHEGTIAKLDGAWDKSLAEIERLRQALEYIGDRCNCDTLRWAQATARAALSTTGSGK